MTVWNQLNVTPGTTGVETVYPWTCDLRTDAGRRQFDIAIAALFRITNWHIEGGITSDPDDDPMTEITDNIDGDVVMPTIDERLIVSEGSFDETGPVNDKLDIPDPVSLADVEVFSFPIAPVVVDSFGTISFHFRATGATNFKIVDTVKGGSLTEEVGNLTIRVPAWRGTGYHELTTPLFSSDDFVTANFTITGDASLEYKDADEVPVWNANATPALDPVTAHTDMHT